MKKFYHIAALLIGALLFVTPCIGEQITIFGNHNKSPKVYLDQKTPKGILIEIMKYVDSESANSFDYQLFPWKRAYTLALSGKGGIIGLSMTSERLKSFDYSEIMYYDDLLLVVLKGNEFNFSNIKDLKGKKVGALRGASYGEDFEKGKKDLFTVEEDGNGKQRLLKLLHNRIDIAIIGPGKGAINKIIQSNEMLMKEKDAFVILPTPFKRDPNYLGFPKEMQMQNFLTEFNSILQKGNDSGVIQKIIQEWE